MVNGINFQEEYVQRDTYESGSKTVNFLTKYSNGLIGTKGANYIIIGSVILMIIISIFLFSLNRVDIPKEALINPEYGLPIED